MGVNALMNPFDSSTMRSSTNNFTSNYGQVGMERDGDGDGSKFAGPYVGLRSDGRINSIRRIFVEF
jgi:hypothetical protein